jgi:hypothetical protein
MLAVNADMRKIPWNTILAVDTKFLLAYRRPWIEVRYTVKEPRDAEDV